MKENLQTESNQCNNEKSLSSKKTGIVLGAVVGVLFVGALVAYCFMQSWDEDGNAAGQAIIYQDGKVIETIDLSAVEEAYEKRIEGENGNYNIIQVRPGSIGVIEADCPDKLCQKQGFISDGSVPVVCLPNRLSIEIKKGATDEFDAVAR